MSESNKIVKWLKQRPLIKVNQLFVQAGMDSGNASRCWSKGEIPPRFVKAVENKLIPYGYK